MKNQDYYHKKLFGSMEKLLIATREELAQDLGAGLIDQATFDHCDLQCEEALKALKAELKSITSSKTSKMS